MKTLRTFPVVLNVQANVALPIYIYIYVVRRMLMEVFL